MYVLRFEVYVRNNLAMQWNGWCSWGVPKDMGVAVQCYLKAADQGNPFGQNRLAAMYEHGKGVPKNDQEAQKWYALAAAQGICWKQ